jgi:methylase of polypeptide subunit release factors
VTDPDVEARRLASEALQEGDRTGWFERLYLAAEAGTATVPWDRGEPHRMLVEWAQRKGLDGAGRRGLVIGSGLGDDAELLAGAGYHTVAFDISPTAVRSARRRYPDSAVEFVVADLLDPPAEWTRAFDLVVESLTVQALPGDVRAEATVRWDGSSPRAARWWCTRPPGAATVTRVRVHPGR